MDRGRGSRSGHPSTALQPFEHGRFLRGELDPTLRARLLELRAQRRQPGLDDKAIASWNSLALAALAEAGYSARAAGLGEHGSGRCGVPARAAVVTGRASLPLLAVRAGDDAGFLDDYANVAHGLMELHVATGELRWLEEAHRLALWRSTASPTTSMVASSSPSGTATAARGPRKPLDDNPILRQLDARLGAAAAPQDLGRR